MAAHGASADALDDGFPTTSRSDILPPGSHVDPVKHVEETFITLAHKLKNSRSMMPPLLEVKTGGIYFQIYFAV